MIDVINLMLLGLFAGTISLFWTRILKRKMILNKLGRILSRINDWHIINKEKPHPCIKFLFCSYCLSPWICGLFDLWYVLTYNVGVIPLIIGILAGLGAGNLAVEFVAPLRNE